MKLKPTVDNTIYFNNMISSLINFDNCFKKSYSAKLIKDDETIDVHFIIIQKIFDCIKLYRSYLLFKNIHELFYKNDSKTISIKTSDIPDIYKLKIYLDEYIINIPSIKINPNFCLSIYTTPDTSKVNFDILSKNELELFTIERKDNDLNEKTCYEKMDT